MRICQAKKLEDVERKNCFEIISPGKVILLQADHNITRDKWINAIQVKNFITFKALEIHLVLQVDLIL